MRQHLGEQRTTVRASTRISVASTNRSNICDFATYVSNDFCESMGRNVSDLARYSMPRNIHVMTEFEGRGLGQLTASWAT